MAKTTRSKGMKKVKCSTGCGVSMMIADDAKSGMCWKCVNNMMTSPGGRLRNVPNEVLIDKSDKDEYDDSVIQAPDESWEEA